MNFTGGLKWSKMHQYNDILVSELEETVTFDASTIGWGGGGGGGGEFQGTRTGGAWLPAESQFHINYLELKAAFFALQCFQTQIGGKTVGLRIDNTTAAAAINSRGTGRACSWFKSYQYRVLPHQFHLLLSLPRTRQDQFSPSFPYYTGSCWTGSFMHNLWLTTALLPGYTWGRLEGYLDRTAECAHTHTLF